MATQRGIQAVLVYADIEGSQRYLVETFGFEPGPLHRDASGAAVHGEVSTGASAVWMHRVTREHGLDSPRNLGCASANLVVFVDDVDAHYARVAAAGGRTATTGPVDQDYGLRDYSVLDCEGHLWTFATPR